MSTCSSDDTPEPPETYGDARIGFVDASVAALAERLRIATILTADRRHFSIIRGPAGRPSTLLP